MRIINFCNRIIEYSFYALFFLVPFTFASDTSELFEFNKMWLTYALTLIIAASWFIKMILQRRVFIQRTPLDIPIALFLTSQIISTIFSLDRHVSIWGYYSRFNGGLLSIISYIFLYYSFLSNFKLSIDAGSHEKHEFFREIRKNIRDFSETDAAKMVKRLFFVSLISGTIVSLWGLPSHFGYDPTCFLFRGTLDVSCWTADFQPMVRIFSTLGQPDWLAAYLAILLPISIAFFFKTFETQTPNNQEYQKSNIKNQISKKSLIFTICYLIFTILFYLDLLYSGARSGVLAAWFSLALFAIGYFLIEGTALFKYWYVLVVFVVLFSITFLVGTPIANLNKFTLPGIKTQFINSNPTVANGNPTPTSPAKPVVHAGEFGGTDSAKIRLHVWQGAIDAWRNYPIFGTGVETFAFAYYRFRPQAHNLTSEWNFLYNKAHNEFLNYLATTGVFGLGTYLLMIGWFILLFFKHLNPKSEARNPKQYQNSNDKNSKRFEHSDFENSNLFRVSNFEFRILTVALLASYISILTTNFFGFSVVITNIYLFLIPAFIFVLGKMINPQKSFGFSLKKSSSDRITIWQWNFVVLIMLIALYILVTLFRFWNADKAYALGSNLDRAGEFQKAYPKLHEAVVKRGDEPVFKDEQSINDAILATALLSQKDTNAASSAAAFASSLAQEAIATSNEITSKYPNNLVFWKSRVRVFYSLAQVDPTYISQALEAIKKASELAPTDANVSYNLGVLYGQNGDVKKGIETLENTVLLKPDYKDAHYALGLFYHEQAIDKNAKVINSGLQEKAIEQMKYILAHISETDPSAKEALKTWGKK